MQTKQAKQMNEAQWEIAHDIAFELVDRGTDPNELGKVLAFIRQYQNADNAKDRLLLMVGRLANSSNALIRSRQTQRFYRNIQEACQQHLRGINEADELLQVLGWSLRLMRYYRIEPKRATEEQWLPHSKSVQRENMQRQIQVPKSQPKPTSEPPKQPEQPKIRVGDRINATILKKNGMEVTVRLQTNKNEEVVFERPYYPGQVGAQIKVRVLGVNESGQVTKVIP